MTYNEFFFDLTEEQRHDKVRDALVHLLVIDNANIFNFHWMLDQTEDMEILKIVAGAYMNGEIKEHNVQRLGEE